MFSGRETEEGKKKTSPKTVLMIRELLEIKTANICKADRSGK